MKQSRSTIQLRTHTAIDIDAGGRATRGLQKVVTAAEMRRIEDVVIQSGTSSETLMGRAGSGAARHIRAWLGGLTRRPVVILCGPGKNGGDGLLMARALDTTGATVMAYTVGRDVSDAISGPFRRYRAEDDSRQERLGSLVDGAAVIVDALLGTGRARPITGLMASVLQTVAPAAAERTVVALDLPSGLDADTGAIDQYTLRADLTLTFGFPKRGLLLQPGASYSGALVTIDIGLPDNLADDVQVFRPEAEDIATVIPPRSPVAHKYSAGAVLVMAGSPRYPGAPRLVALAAGRAGAGLVTVATGHSTIPLIASSLLETTFLPLPESERGGLHTAGFDEIRATMAKYRSIIIGPGLGQDTHTAETVLSLISALRYATKRDSMTDQNAAGKDAGKQDRVPHAVIDADALNILARQERWWELLPPHTILTPHEGELHRLRQAGPAADPLPGSTDRVDVAQAAARHWNVVLVAKGAPTIIAAPDGRTVINVSGGVNLATAGTGDVLAGITAALVAQGANPFDAAVAAAYIHGSAGDQVRKRMGDRGTLASDLLPAIPQVIRELLATTQPLSSQEDAMSE